MSGIPLKCAVSAVLAVQSRVKRFQTFSTICTTKTFEWMFSWGKVGERPQYRSFTVKCEILAAYDFSWCHSGVLTLVSQR
eukprot:436774-Rhodomonas_salina.2